MTASTAGVPPDPTGYDYSRPYLDCDLIMKGGITSGVVYPHAVCELARSYRLHSVGGASAGAIAASAAAAAELGRDTGGFNKLAAVPDELRQNSKLVSLFQPERGTRALFELVLAGTRAKGSRRKLWAISKTSVRFFWWAWLAAAGLLFMAGALVRGVDGPWWQVALAGLVGAVLAILAVAVVVCAVPIRAMAQLPRNLLGMCTGLGEDGPPGVSSLTPWLADKLDDLSGRCDGDEPLTFGDLWRGPDGRGTAEEPCVALELMTTNLTNGTAERLPFGERGLFFDPDELRRLFPQPIVDWMVDHAPPALPEARTKQDRRANHRWQLKCLQLEPLRPLPDAEHLPVVFGARLSLSFPVLISAVPLRSVDMTDPDNQQADRDWDRRLSKDPDGFEDDPRGWFERQEGLRRLTAEPCWYSDGGIASNFPIHFFDAPLPRWPTFGIDLMKFHRSHPQDEDECKNVWLPGSNLEGRGESWSGIRSISGLLAAIGHTMQNRVDSAQMRVHGYRERIVHVKHSDIEGGMNLDMPDCVIRRLAERGRCAGQQIGEQFSDHPPKPDALNWNEHRWIRYRSTMSMLEEMLAKFGKAYCDAPLRPGDPSYAGLITRRPDEPPRSYRWERNPQRDLGREVTRQLAEIGWPMDPDRRQQSLQEGAPKPEPELRIVPRL